ncbi:MAG: acyltransferase [Oligoflexales bacterium]|nr:acyltransferase [Oligoflexales bacterium]
MEKNEFVLSETSSVTLDLIRLAAAQAVLLGHATSMLPIFKYVKQPFFPTIQNISVLVFFILSGFIIPYSTSSRMKKDVNYSFKEYFIERFSRIYSGYLPGILFVLLVDSWVVGNFPETYIFHESFNMKSFVANLFMFQNYPIVGNIFHISTFGSASPFWTLATEWWIYLSFGWFFVNVRKSLITGLPVSSIIAFLLLSIVPVYNIFGGGAGGGLSVYWIMGYLVYHVKSIDREKPADNHREDIIFFLFFGFSALAYAINTKKEYDGVLAVLFTLSLYFLIGFCQSTKLRYSTRTKKLIKFTAGYSFTLYLVHYTITIFCVFSWKVKISPYFKFLIIIISCNVISATIAYFTEMRYRNVASFLKGKYCIWGKSEFICSNKMEGS